MGGSLPSVKIPHEYYEILKDLKADIWLETRRHVSFVELMAAILKEVDWEAFKADQIKNVSRENPTKN